MARRSRRTEEDYLPPENDDEEFEEEEEERPRRRRRPRDDDEDEEEERPRRRRARDDDDDEEDDEEEEERPRRRGARAEKPARGRRRSARDDDDDEEEEERPRRKKSSRSAAGWGHYQKAKEKTSKFTNGWKPSPDDDESLIKFLDDEPFGSYAVHWFMELPRGTKKSWMCLESLPDPEPCPACEIGDSPKGKALFRVAVFDDEGQPEVRVLEAGTWLADDLEKKASSKLGPLSKHYWSISASGGGNTGPVRYSLESFRDRELEEDWGFPPLSEEELEELEEVTFELEDLEQVPNRSEFKKVVRSLDD